MNINIEIEIEAILEKKQRKKTISIDIPSIVSNRNTSCKSIGEISVLDLIPNEISINLESNEFASLYKIEDNLYIEDIFYEKIPLNELDFKTSYDMIKIDDDQQRIKKVFTKQIPGLSYDEQKNKLKIIETTIKKAEKKIELITESLKNYIFIDSIICRKISAPLFSISAKSDRPEILFEEQLKTHIRDKKNFLKKYIMNYNELLTITEIPDEMPLFFDGSSPSAKKKKINLNRIRIFNKKEVAYDMRQYWAIHSLQYFKNAFENREDLKLEKLDKTFAELYFKLKKMDIEYLTKNDEQTIVETYKLFIEKNMPVNVEVILSATQLKYEFEDDLLENLTI